MKYIKNFLKIIQIFYQRALNFSFLWFKMKSQKNIKQYIAFAFKILLKNTPNYRNIYKFNIFGSEHFDT